ncbi:MAG TPA: hypothetical protein DCG12_05305 [Planctomycetaceae bacterium]|nr:hypothetical protein [Planctomycetaceae bacterium]
MKRILSTLAVLSLLVVSTGCQSIMHELQPHRLWRMNYSDPPGRSAAGSYFSLSDDLDKPIPGHKGQLAEESLQK